LANQSNLIRVPVHMVEKVSKVSRAKYELTQKHGREPSVQEIAKHMKVSQDHVREIQQVDQKPTYLENVVGHSDQDNRKLSDFLEDKHNASPAAFFAEALQQKQMEQMLTTLTPKEREIIEMRFGLTGKPPATLEETGKYFDLTRERIRQIELVALKKMREFLRIQPKGMDELFND
jgi:RNA polymerase primary sigma factor